MFSNTLAFKMRYANAFLPQENEIVLITLISTIRFFFTEGEQNAKRIEKPGDHNKKIELYLYIDPDPEKGMIEAGSKPR